MKRIAIIGGGIAGVTAAWQLAQSETRVNVTLFEASSRLGGIVETVHERGFVIDCGPDAWVTEKPGAQQLAEELGLASQLLSSNDATRKTYILQRDKLVAMPDGMRMMVPTNLEALAASPLFSEQAQQAFREEPTRAHDLKRAASTNDESVASFVRRHFGDEVLQTIGVPLLSGVFGGDVTTLSVRAVMAPFVAMEQEHGSLIAALQARTRSQTVPIFTTLRGGIGTLIDAMIATIPSAWIKLCKPVTSLQRKGDSWKITTINGEEDFDIVMIAAPAHAASDLLHATDAEAAELMHMDASSAIVVGFGFSQSFDLPPGFGFLVPPGTGGENSLLAATFVDQKFEDRAPIGKRLLRAFFGGETGARLLHLPDESIIDLAYGHLTSILGTLPKPEVTVLRRLPRSLPQYSIGHLERMAELDQRVRNLNHLWLIGNGYRGVGLPDLIRDARAAAQACLR